jgi:hypothetical protein
VTNNEPFRERQVRAAVDESACRQGNERTQDLSDAPALTAYTCECTQACAALVSLTHDEYEGVRKDPTHFLAAPGHLVVGVEVIVRETPRYHVVEKIGAAVAVAVRPDRREAPVGDRNVA